MHGEKKSKIIVAVGGGKGGVGKSIFSVALGAILAEQGHSVVLADLDLGAANLHACLGILRKTPTIADFIQKRTASLEEILIDTYRNNVKLISGADFMPGMANPAYWMKLKIMRHIKALPADIVILDLGAGVHFNTLDFFGISDRGIVVTSPEPGAVMNAYGFIKGALFRKLQSIFRKHPDIGPLIEYESRKTEGENRLTLEQFAGEIKKIDPEVYPLIHEVEQSFNPALVVNRVPAGQSHILVKNLLTLCTEKLGIAIEHAGNLPDSKEITDYLLNIPGFLDTVAGKLYRSAVESIIDKLNVPARSAAHKVRERIEYSDEDVQRILQVIEELDESIFSGTNREAWKLRMYFKPSEVVNFLVSRGVSHESLSLG
jgi:flagellar biosynthesis protein FlhG